MEIEMENCSAGGHASPISGKGTNWQTALLSLFAKFIQNKKDIIIPQWENKKKTIFLLTFNVYQSYVSVQYQKI